MKYSIMTEPQMGGTYEEILRAARHAESEGLHSFARSDHLAWNREHSPEATDSLTTLAGLARDAATIDQMSAGRFDLGIGTGWNEFEHEALGIPFPGSAERWQRLEDAVDYLLAAFDDGHQRHNGPFYSLDLDVGPKPTGLRIIVGGSGPRRTPRLAGTKADEYNFFVCPPDEARAKIETMRRSAGDRKVEATMMGPVTVAGSDGELADRLVAAAARRDITSDELISRWEKVGIIFGTQSQVRDKIAAFEEAGVERIYLQWLDLSDDEGMMQMLELVRG
jgi:alkanesulfonate monooxygenase SsuD/methylene tetrahydromethanopterin reductase-like flavin-dependent oxidoreductase (luciferase family)